MALEVRGDMKCMMVIGMEQMKRCQAWRWMGCPREC